MTRLVLHIGMEKTGTSALQRFLARNRAALRLMGVRYPRSGGPAPEKHQDLVEAIEAWSSGTEHPEHGPPDAVIDRYLEGARRSSITVLSAEGLSAPDPAFARAFAPLAARLDVTVVVYLRRQDEWALSAYRQAVIDETSAEARPIGAWLADPATRARLDYDTILRGWEDAFGRGALRVLRYPHDLPLVPRFVRAAGLPGSAALLRQQDRRVNESVDDTALLEALTRNGGEPQVPILDQPARDALLSELDPCNAALRARHFPRNATLFGIS